MHKFENKNHKYEVKTIIIDFIIILGLYLLYF